MESVVIAAMLFGAFFLGFYVNRLQPKKEDPEKKEEIKKPEEPVLECRVYRKEKPSEDEQLMNVLLYDGSDQHGGESDEE